MAGARPTAVTVFGVLNIVFGALGLLGTPFSAMVLAASDARNPVVVVLRENAGYRAWFILGHCLGVVVAIALVVTGIGLLKLKPWARKASIAYGIYAIAMGVIGFIVNAVYLFGPLMERARQAHGAEAGAAIGGTIGGALGGCLALVYPVLLLIFMTRPNVAAAFRTQAPQDAP